MQNYSPTFYSSAPPPPVQKKERGAFLSLVLGVSTLWNVVATFLVVMGGAYLDKATADGATAVQALGGSDNGMHHTVSRAVLALTIFQIAQLVSVCGMWAWKRWAVLGYFATTGLEMLGVIKLTGQIPYSSLIWAGVVLLAVFPRIGSFED
ncbi:MAG: hypothetical protein ABI461_04275 [Polyangiaceae bacterium]